MKSSLTARLIYANWIDHLPWALLGIRTTVKEDLRASAAEMVYGTTLTLPGQFQPALTPTSSPIFLDNLKQAVKYFHPVPTSNHGPTTKEFIPDDLKHYRMVWIRKDGHVPPLGHKYEGPYEVVNRAVKHFAIHIGETVDYITIERFKPANIAEDVSPGQPTKHGRPIKITNVWDIFPENTKADQFKNSRLAKINSERYHCEPRNFEQVLSLLYFLTLYRQ